MASGISWKGNSRKSRFYIEQVKQLKHFTDRDLPFLYDIDAGRRKKRITKGRRNEDIFEDMQQKIGYSFISDLKFMKNMKEQVLWEMRCLRLEDYDEKQLEEFSHYVFGVGFEKVKELLKK